MKYNYIGRSWRIGSLAVAKTAHVKEERARVEAEYHDLYQAYEETKKRMHKLQDESSKVSKEKALLQEEISVLQQTLRDASHRLVDPPRPEVFYMICNQENWFQGYEVDRNGTIYLRHNSQFYPCETIVVPCGALRMHRINGSLVNLTQNHAYAALPKHYAQPYLPIYYEAYKVRILFGTAYGDAFWLGDPRLARDIIVEIWASCDKATDDDLQAWKRQYDGDVRKFSENENVFTLITPFEKFLGSCSRSQTDNIRQQCYAEYLDVYFSDRAT